MSNKFSQINYLSLALVLLGVTIHYLLPQHGLISNLLLFFAVLLHSSAIWGISRTAAYIILACLVGYFAEWIGINTGWIFGVYHYNAAKDPGMLYGVPLFIPMMYSYLIYAGHFTLLAISKNFLRKSNLFILALLTGFLMTLKDLGTDPLHSTVAQIWIWNHGGAYFGVPIHNFLGWFGVFAVMTLITLPCSWYWRDYHKKIHLTRSEFCMPVLLLFVLLVFGVTQAYQASQQNFAMGAVSAFVTVFTLLPYIILAWFNGIKK